MLTLVHNLKPGEQFVDLESDCDLVYTVKSEPIGGEVLCVDEFGSAEMINVDKIVRRWPSEWLKSQVNDHFNM